MTVHDAGQPAVRPSMVAMLIDPGPAHIGDFLGHRVRLPEFVRVRKGAQTTEPVDPVVLTAEALRPHLRQVEPGNRVAIAVGSRGIGQLSAVVRCCVRLLREIGAEPFVVPAMGSHGGATAEGQRRVLARLGIDENSVGAPVLSTMDTVDLGEIEPGLHAYLDANAATADGILIVNRVKSHTSFSGDIESGIAKMAAIGLGKQRGAEELHRLGPTHIEDRIRRVACLTVARSPVLGGLALVEDAAHDLHSVTFLPPVDIAGPGEAQLLKQAKALEPRLPFDRIDVLVVDEIGKDKSGTGMDTNVIGRRMIRGSDEMRTPQVTNLVVLGLSEASGGNAIGVGLADFVPARLLAQVDLTSTYANALTAGLQGVQRAQIPIVLATDRDAVEAALLTASLADPHEARIVRIRDTLTLDDLMISRPLLAECVDRGFELAGPLHQSCLGFAQDGRITGW